ncbi:MAG: DUF3048 domain-containing protein [Anaerolineales bacterium]|nr:MAG: DUF3048 domain-containing protein [Anaerolineales bacterium]
MHETTRTLQLRARAKPGALLLLVASGLVLAGCGASATPTPTRTPRPMVTPTPTATIEPTATPVPPTPTPLPENVNPLTGEVVDDSSVLDRIPVGIKVSNWPARYVRPQAGINSADIIYEHYNEGYMATRWTAIFLSEDAERVGPVRSCRLIDLQLPAIYKFVMACWGFSDGVAAIARDMEDLYPNRIASYSLGEEIAPDPFFRDTTRDVPTEHTGYTSPENVRAWAEAHGYTGRQDLSGLVFSDEPPPGGVPATYIHLPYQVLDVEWRYDEDSGRYERWSDGDVHTDYLDGEQLSAANVIVLYVPHWETDIMEDQHNNVYSLEYAIWNSNIAIIFRDGMRYDGYWQRWERTDMLTVTDEDGAVIPLKVGNSFYQVIPAEGLEIAVEP